MISDIKCQISYIKFKRVPVIEFPSLYKGGVRGGSNRVRGGSNTVRGGSPSS